MPKKIIIDAKLLPHVDSVIIEKLLAAHEKGESEVTHLSMGYSFSGELVQSGDNYIIIDRSNATTIRDTVFDAVVFRRGESGYELLPNPIANNNNDNARFVIRHFSSEKQTSQYYNEYQNSHAARLLGGFEPFVDLTARQSDKRKEKQYWMLMPKYPNGSSYASSGDFIPFEGDKFAIVCRKLGTGGHGAVFDAAVFTGSGSEVEFVSNPNYEAAPGEANFVLKYLFDEKEEHKFRREYHCSIMGGLTGTCEPVRVNDSKHAGIWMLMPKYPGKGLDAILYPSQHKLITHRTLGPQDIELRLLILKLIIDSAIKQLLEPCIEHIDLSLDNILIDLPNEVHSIDDIFLKIIDFGSAIPFDSEDPVEDYKFPFLPPEMMNKQRTLDEKCKSDIYAIGRIAALLFGYARALHLKNNIAFKDRIEAPILFADNIEMTIPALRVRGAALWLSR